MRKKITFWKLLGNWFLVALILGLINTLFIKSTIVNSLILASLSIILLIYPVYPQNLESRWTPKKCRLFIRILAVLEIILAFATRTNFYNDDNVTVYSTTIVTTNTSSSEALLQLGIITVVVIAVIVAVIVYRKKKK